MVRNIDESRNPPLDRFLAGLNIAGFSRQRAQMLTESGIDSLEKLLSLSAEEIAAVKGFGDILAEAVSKGLESRRSRIDRLLAAGVTPYVPETRSVSGESGPFAGKTFCFSGAVRRVDEETGKRYTRSQMRKLVTRLGGKPVNDVATGLDYLVLANPDSTSSKAKKARKLGIKILSEEEFFASADSGD